MKKVTIEYFEIFKVSHATDEYHSDYKYFASQEEAKKYAALEIGWFCSGGSIWPELVEASKINRYKVYNSAKEAAIETGVSVKTFQKHFGL